MAEREKEEACCRERNFQEENEQVILSRQCRTRVDIKKSRKEMETIGKEKNSIDTDNMESKEEEMDEISNEKRENKESEEEKKEINKESENVKSCETCEKDKEWKERVVKLEEENRKMREGIEELYKILKESRLEMRNENKRIVKEIEGLKKRLEKDGLKGKKEEEQKYEGKRSTEVEKEEKEEKWEINIEENALIIAKGKKWKEANLRKWLEEKIGEANWELKVFKENKDKGLLIFEKKEKKEELWRKREEIWREEVYAIDEWLSIEERKDRFCLLKSTREMEDKAKKLGIKLKIKKENKWLEIDGTRYKWNRKEERLEEIKGN